MRELKSNDRIAFTELEWDTIEKLFVEIDSIKLGLEYLCKSLFGKEKELWEFIHAVKPELDGFRAMVERSEKQLIVLKKLK